jgi:hypothetical protein
MTTETNFCLRADVDTYEGLKYGVPKIVRLSKELDFPVTIYLSLGKFTTGRNIFRIIKSRKNVQLNIQGFKRNYNRSLVRGLILPSKTIGSKEKEFLNTYDKDELLEFHPHGFNHIKWSSNFDNFSYERTKEFIEATVNEYELIFNKKPTANAAPNFQTNKHYFELLKKLNFDFSSDFYKMSPFNLEIDKTKNNSKSCNIIQLTVTEPTIEELLLKGKSIDQIKNKYEKTFERYVDQGVDYVCMYIHSVFEPIRLEKLLHEICQLIYNLDMKPTTHNNFYKKVKELPKIKYSELLK